MTTLDDVMAEYATLNEHGRTYLLGWIVGAIRDEGRATIATLEAAVPLAARWGEKWSASS
jgi:hypothetical protein